MSIAHQHCTTLEHVCHQHSTTTSTHTLYIHQRTHMRTYDYAHVHPHTGVHMHAG